MRGRKRLSEQSAEVAGRAFPSWTQRQTYVPSNLSAQKPPRKKSSPSTEKSTTQQRLPGSPPGGPKLMWEVLSIFKGHQGWRESRASSAIPRPQTEDPQPLKGWSPGREGILSGTEPGQHERGSPKTLATAAALEGEIERLSCPFPRGSQRLEAPMREAETAEYIGPWNAKRGSAEYHLVTLLPPIHQLKAVWFPLEGSWPPEDPDLGEPPELEPRVTSFLTGSVESSKEE